MYFCEVFKNNCQLSMARLKKKKEINLNAGLVKRTSAVEENIFQLCCDTSLTSPYI